MNKKLAKIEEAKALKALKIVPAPQLLSNNALKKSIKNLTGDAKNISVGMSGINTAASTNVSSNKPPALPVLDPKNGK